MCADRRLGERSENDVIPGVRGRAGVARHRPGGLIGVGVGVGQVYRTSCVPSYSNKSTN